jgi:hypothetical protein
MRQPSTRPLSRLRRGRRSDRVRHLNSERIRRKFGSFGIDILECSEQRRVSSLYSLEHGRRVCRTHAVVEFGDGILPALAREHALVLSGESIGVVFRDRGWIITKRHTHVGSAVFSSEHADLVAAMNLEPPQKLAVHSYIFEVRKNSVSRDYAAITELHHPEYLRESDLRRIYGDAGGHALPASVTAQRRATIGTEAL